MCKISPDEDASRAHDVYRTAEEIREQFLNDHTNFAGASENRKKTARVIANPNLSDAAKVQYIAANIISEKGFAWSNDRLGKLLNKGPQAIQRGWRELEKNDFVITTRRKQNTATRAFPVPDAITTLAKEIEKELRRKPKGRGQGSHEDLPVDDQERPNSTVLDASFDVAPTNGTTSPNDNPFRQERSNSTPRTVESDLQSQRYRSQSKALSAEPSQTHSSPFSEKISAMEMCA
ncbi:MAG: hypothetical protein WAN43_01270 [Rhodomicrobium sp.]